jgi:hypothetical protein
MGSARRFPWSLTISALSLFLLVAMRFVDVKPLVTIDKVWLSGALHKASPVLMAILSAVTGFGLGWFLSTKKKVSSMTLADFLHAKRAEAGKRQPAPYTDKPMARLTTITEALALLLKPDMTCSFYYVFHALGTGKGWLGELGERITSAQEDFFHLQTRMQTSSDWKGSCSQLGTIIQRVERACILLGEHRDEWPSDWSKSQVNDLAEKYAHFASLLSDFTRDKQLNAPSAHSLRTLLNL